MSPARRHLVPVVVSEILSLRCLRSLPIAGRDSDEVAFCLCHRVSSATCCVHPPFDGPCRIFAKLFCNAGGAVVAFSVGKVTGKRTARNDTEGYDEHKEKIAEASVTQEAHVALGRTQR
ncbi:unnamed protein product [Lampetra planeri]